MTRQEFDAQYTVYPAAIRHCMGLWGRIILGRSARLFRGPDHFLNIPQPFFVEQWQRLHYSDIKAVVQTRTKRWIWHATFWGCISAILFLIMLMTAGLSFELVTAPFWVLLLICLYYLAANLVMGPTCTVSIVTAVQAYDIPALRREKVAKKVLPEIGQLIRQAQAQQPPVPEAAPSVANPAHTPPLG